MFASFKAELQSVIDQMACTNEQDHEVAKYNQLHNEVDTYNPTDLSDTMLLTKLTVQFDSAMSAQLKTQAVYVQRNAKGKEQKLHSVKKT